MNGVAIHMSVIYIVLYYFIFFSLGSADELNYTFPHQITHATLISNCKFLVCSSTIVLVSILRIPFKVSMGFDHHEPIFQLYRETTEYQACIDKFERARMGILFREIPWI
jgi:hypothetical protein